MLESLAGRVWHGGQRYSAIPPYAAEPHDVHRSVAVSRFNRLIPME
jgi:hypothetical protein